MRPVMGGTSRAQPYLWVGIICACKGGRGGMSAHICAHMCVYMAYRVPGTRVDEGSWGGGVCVSTAAESLRSHVLMGTVCCAWAASTRRRWGTGLRGRGCVRGAGRAAGADTRGGLWGCCCCRRGARAPWGQRRGSCLLQDLIWVPAGTSPVPPRHAWATKRGFWRGHAHNPLRGTQAILPVLEHPETLPGLSPAKDSP